MVPRPSPIRRSPGAKTQALGGDAGHHRQQDADASDGDDEACQDQGPLCVPLREALGGERGCQHADCGGGEDHPGLDGIVVTHDLQVGGDHERHAHEQQPLGVLGDQAEVGDAIAEQAGRQQWLLARALLGAHRCEEPHQDQGTGGDKGERQPEVVVRGQDAQHQEDEADSGQDRPAGVEGDGTDRAAGGLRGSGG